MISYKSNVLIMKLLTDLLSKKKKLKIFSTTIRIKQIIMVKTRSGKETILKTKDRKTKHKKHRTHLCKLIPIQEDEEEISPQQKETENDEFIFSDEESESEEEEEEFLEESFPIPHSLQETKSVKLKNYYNRLIKKIKRKEPTIEKILKSEIRMKRKLEMIQQFFIFKFSYPYSEERLYKKKKIMEKLSQYEREFQDFKKNKTKFMNLEEMEKADSDLIQMKSKLMEIETSEKNIKILFQKYNALESKSTTSAMDDEFFKALNWFRLCLKLPFNRRIDVTHPYQNEISKFLYTIRQELDEELYGMTDVKEQLLLYVHNRLMNPITVNNAPLCLLGAPGVGKTSIATVLAKVLYLPYAQINMGGVHNSEFLLGFDSCYVGSKPGKIANALIQSSYKNILLFFDEFDKILNNKEIVNSFLHILDPEQNTRFKDNFFGDIEIDISNCWFIMSLNEKLTEEKALDDRLFYIQINGYTEKEKTEIVKKHLLPKSLSSLNLKENDIIMSEEILRFFVRKFSPGESGVRVLKQQIQDLCSKLLFLVNNQDNMKVSFRLPDKIQLPIHVSEQMINTVLKNKEKRINSSISHMYI